MANRDVTITLKVKDGEVVDATKAVERLKKAAADTRGDGIRNAAGQDRAALASAQRLGISYDDYIKKTKLAAAGSKEVTRAVTDTANAAKTAAPAVGRAGAALGGLVGTAGSVALAVTGVVVVIGLLVAAAFKIGQVIFDLTKQFADYALAIGRMSEDTGLAAKTVSVLSSELEKQGRSFNDIKGQVNEFRKVLAQAAAGSEEARSRLAALGITDVAKGMTDFNGAFITAITAIENARDPVEKIRLAYAGFGAEGHKLLPILREFPGDLQKISQRAKELNLIVGDEGVAKGKEFQRVWSEIKQQSENIGRTFGSSLGGPVIRVMTNINEALARNKDSIKSWADSVASHLERVIALVEQRPISTLFGGALAAAYVQATDTPVKLSPNFNAVGPDRSKIEGRQPSTQPDPALLEAMRAEAEKLQKEREEIAKRNNAAQIQLLKGQLQQVQKTYKTSYDDLKKVFEENGDVAAFFNNQQAAIQSLNDEMVNILPALEALETAAARAKDSTAAELAVLVQEQAKRRQDIASTNIANMQDRDEAIKKAAKKNSDDRIKNIETEMNRVTALRDARGKTDIANAQRDHETMIISESQMIQKINLIELDALDARKRALNDFLKQVTGNKEKESEVKHELLLLDQQIAQQQIANSNRVLDAKKREQEVQNELKKKYEDYKQSLEDELAAVLRNNRPLTRYAEVLRDIERGHIAVNDEVKQKTLLTLAAQADAVDELNRKHAELKEFFSDSLRYVFEGDFDGLFKSLQRRVTEPFIDRLSGLFATSILGFDPNATNNPVAKPIVGKLDETNKILGAILQTAGGSPVSAAVGGGSFSNILNGIIAGFGGGSGAIGPGGTPVFNGGNFAGGGFNFGGFRLPGDRTGTIDESGAFVVDGRSSWKKLLGPGGLFGQQGFGNNTGTYGGIGALAGLAGGLIGGRVGGFISGAGAGLGIGAQIGTMIMPGIGTAVGAAIGAIAGGLASLFGGDPKRKADKRENIPALNKGFADAIKRLNEILQGVRTLSIDPDEAVSRASEVRAEIAGGFGIQFQSKKYRKQAQTMISGKLNEADAIIAQIKSAAEIARGAADRSKRILPEFAGGVFLRPNGLIPGVFDGRDDVLSLLSRGELVMNPGQQHTVRQLAGFDVFAHAGIPNYPKGSASPKLATGGIANTSLALSASPQVMVQPQFTLYVEGVNFTDSSKAWVESEDGRRTIVKVFKKERKMDRTL